MAEIGDICVRDYNDAVIQEALYNFITIPKGVTALKREELCSYLRAWRRYFGCKVHHVAREASIELQRYSALERGDEDAFPTAWERSRLSAFFRVHPNCIFVKSKSG